jgi:hypothetical protein
MDALPARRYIHAVGAIATELKFFLFVIVMVPIVYVIGYKLGLRS